MVRATCLVATAAAFLSSPPVQAAVQPGQAELEAALRAHFVRIASYPKACRNGPAPGCIKPPKAIKVRDYDCQATGTDADGGPILFCRVTYIHKGGSLAHVRSPNECVPLRSGGATSTAWEVALVDAKGRCPGARN